MAKSANKKLKSAKRGRRFSAIFVALAMAIFGTYWLVASHADSIWPMEFEDEPPKIWVNVPGPANTTLQPGTTFTFSFKGYLYNYADSASSGLPPTTNPVEVNLNLSNNTDIAKIVSITCGNATACYKSTFSGPMDNTAFPQGVVIPTYVKHNSTVCFNTPTEPVPREPINPATAPLLLTVTLQVQPGHTIQTLDGIEDATTLNQSISHYFTWGYGIGFGTCSTNTSANKVVWLSLACQGDCSGGAGPNDGTYVGFSGSGSGSSGSGKGNGKGTSSSGKSASSSGATATKQSNQQNSIPKSSPQGTEKQTKQPAASPFYDGKQYQPGSEADTIQSATIAAQHKSHQEWLYTGIAVVLTAGVVFMLRKRLISKLKRLNV